MAPVNPWLRSNVLLAGINSTHTFFRCYTYWDWAAIFLSRHTINSLNNSQVIHTVLWFLCFPTHKKQYLLEPIFVCTDRYSDYTCFISLQSSFHPWRHKSCLISNYRRYYTHQLQTSPLAHTWLGVLGEQQFSVFQLNLHCHILIHNLWFNNQDWPTFWLCQSNHLTKDLYITAKLFLQPSATKWVLELQYLRIISGRTTLKHSLNFLI